MKRKNQIIVSVLALLFANISFSQKSKGYIINGKIQNLKNGTNVYLIRTNENNGADTVSTISSNNGTFKFSGQLEREGELYFVKLDTSKIKMGPKRQTWARLLLANSSVKIAGDLKSWPIITISGSALTSEYESLEESASKIANEAQEKTHNLGSDRLLISEEKRNYQKTIEELIAKHLHSFAAPLIALNYSLPDTTALQGIYVSLSDPVKESFYGLKMVDFIQSLKIQATIREGAVIPSFATKSVDGKRISIIEEATKAKFTLIDFWASWCKPCREELPNLIKVYNQFHDKGFNIISISEDDNIASWRKTVQELNAPWTQTLQGNVQIGKDIFGLMSIPGYVLIDDKGKMIAFTRGFGKVPSFGPEIRGEELSKTIESILQSQLQ